MFPGDIQSTIIMTTLLILLLIAGVVITIFIANRRQVQQQVKIVQMQADYVRELRAAEQEAQEQVLVNVARDLHDNIGQLLTVMRQQVQYQMVVNPALVEFLQNIDNTLDYTTEEVRRMSRSLNSDLLDGYGLVNTMQQEVIRLQQLKKYTVRWEFDEEPVLTKDQKVITFRIFQEIINNILKHARSSQIFIQLQGGSAFRMVVSDNGRGFDVEEKLRSGGGSGLKNMLKRAELARLKCEVISATDKGTTFTLQQNTQ